MDIEYEYYANYKRVSSKDDEDIYEDPRVTEDSLVEEENSRLKGD